MKMVNKADVVAIPKVAALLDHVEAELLKLLGEKLKRVILYGSYSRGNYDDESDIDLMALVDAHNPDKAFEEQILEIMVDLSLEHETVLSIFLENVSEYEEAKEFKPFFKRVEREGIDIYAA
jgi:predicted nucleotidyltransferase